MFLFFLVLYLEAESTLFKLAKLSLPEVGAVWLSCRKLPEFPIRLPGVSPSWPHTTSMGPGSHHTVQETLLSTTGVHQQSH